jgi:ABC-type uncharacterized transport system ATPase subunit
LGKFQFQGTLAELQAHYAPLLYLQVNAHKEVYVMLSSNGYNVSMSNGGLQIAIVSPAQAENINRLILDQGYQIQQSYIRQPNLEDIFMNLTGK